MESYKEYDYRVTSNYTLEAVATDEHIDIISQKAMELNRSLIEKEEQFTLQLLTLPALLRLKSLAEKRINEIMESG